MSIFWFVLNIWLDIFVLHSIDLLFDSRSMLKKITACAQSLKTTYKINNNNKSVHLLYFAPDIESIPFVSYCCFCFYFVIAEVIWSIAITIIKLPFNWMFIEYNDSFKSIAQKIIHWKTSRSYVFIEKSTFSKIR